MMNFRVIKAALVTLLGDAEASRYETIGFQRKVVSAKEAHALRKVQVYFASGQLPKSSGRVNGPVQHVITYRVELRVASAAVGDLAPLAEGSGATDGQRADALTAFQEAAEIADDAFDELVDIIYQIIMDARNVDLGLAIGIVAERYIAEIQKDNPVPQGQYVMLTGSMDLTCRTDEQVDGDPGIAGDAFDNTIGIDGDPNDNTGAAGTLGG